MDDDLAPLASAATSLTELTRRILDAADQRLAAGDEAGAADLYEIERSLRQALRRLDTYLSARR
jgi:hypothetical protein